MNSDTLGKGQKKSSVAIILNVAYISYVSQISRLSSARDNGNDDNTIISSSNRNIRNKDNTLSYRLVIMRLQSQVITHLIENYGITLVQWNMDVDITKVEPI